MVWPSRASAAMTMNGPEPDDVIGTEDPRGVVRGIRRGRRGPPAGRRRAADRRGRGTGPAGPGAGAGPPTLVVDRPAGPRPRATGAADAGPRLGPATPTGRRWTSWRRRPRQRAASPPPGRPAAAGRATADGRRDGRPARRAGQSAAPRRAGAGGRRDGGPAGEPGYGPPPDELAWAATATAGQASKPGYWPAPYRLAAELLAAVADKRARHVRRRAVACGVAGVEQRSRRLAGHQRPARPPAATPPRDQGVALAADLRRIGAGLGARAFPGRPASAPGRQDRAAGMPGRQQRRAVRAMADAERARLAVV